ncbi:MAG: LURP-one-related/scramblase family protein [Methanosarcina sp.]
MRRIMGGIRGRGSGTEGIHIYKMTEKLVSIGDDYWIEDETGQRVYCIDGKTLRIRDTLILKDSQGNVLYRLREKLLRIRDTMDIENANGGTAATIKKALITPLRDRWGIEVANGPELNVQGNILDHEYRIQEGRKRIAGVSKKWFRVRDTYGVEILPGQDNALILAITVALDQMAHS